MAIGDSTIGFVDKGQMIKILERFRNKVSEYPPSDERDLLEAIVRKLESSLKVGRRSVSFSEEEFEFFMSETGAKKIPWGEASTLSEYDVAKQFEDLPFRESYKTSELERWTEKDYPKPFISEN